MDVSDDGFSDGMQSASTEDSSEHTSVCDSDGDPDYDPEAEEEETSSSGSGDSGLTEDVEDLDEVPLVHLFARTAGHLKPTAAPPKKRGRKPKGKDATSTDLKKRTREDDEAIVIDTRERTPPPPPRAFEWYILPVLCVACALPWIHPNTEGLKADYMSFMLAACEIAKALLKNPHLGLAWNPLGPAWKKDKAGGYSATPAQQTELFDAVLKDNPTGGCAQYQYDVAASHAEGPRTVPQKKGVPPRPPSTDSERDDAPSEPDDDDPDDDPTAVYYDKVQALRAEIKALKKERSAFKRQNAGLKKTNRKLLDDLEANECQTTFEVVGLNIKLQNFDAKCSGLETQLSLANRLLSIERSKCKTLRDGLAKLRTGVGKCKMSVSGLPLHKLCGKGTTLTYSGKIALKLFIDTGNYSNQELRFMFNLPVDAGNKWVQRLSNPAYVAKMHLPKKSTRRPRPKERKARKLLAGVMSTLGSYRSIGVIQQKFALKGLVIGRSSVRRVLRDAGYAYINKVPTLMLTDDQRAYRVLFAKQMLAENARTGGAFFQRLVFTDESWMVIGDSSKKSWMSPDDTVPRNRTHHATKVMMWGGISAAGVTDLHWCEK